MIDFDKIDYLENGTERQRQAFQLLSENQVLGNLAAFEPILVGTIPINIDIASSDLDIICYWENKLWFQAELLRHFGAAQGFMMREVLIDGQETVIANFRLGAFDLEVFGQNIPVKMQNAYRHLIVEYKILQSKGEPFRLEVIALKQQGYKTEPAFGRLLGLENPYEQLLDYPIG
jgi:hypothetical protein